VRAFRDPASLAVGAALVGGLVVLLLAAERTHRPTPRHQTEPPALVSVTRTNSLSLHRRYPRGQIQADLHTFVNMMRYVLTPESPAITHAPAAAV
jgi:hypothetical protein